MKPSHHITVLLLIITCGCGVKQADDCIFSNGSFTMMADSVVQGKMVSRAWGDSVIESTYRSPHSGPRSSEITFRLSLSSRDNELPLGKVHKAVVTRRDTTRIKWGRIVRQDNKKVKSSDTMSHNALWTLEVDMRSVLRSIKRRGWYVAQGGDTIFKKDFKGVYVAGDVEPLTWDFDNLYNRPAMKLHDRGDSIYTVTLRLNPTLPAMADKGEWRISSARKKELLKQWPAYQSDQTMVDALYMMSLDEIDQNRVKGGDWKGTFRTGASWEGVWTRDVSYSAILALALLDPETTMNSLRAKLKNGRIVQDTGTGGAWPVSSDRVVWGIAAWEVYLATGSESWLKEAKAALKRSVEDDLKTVYDPRLGLMHGEQSYLDWREQSYPKWMQPADIYSSLCLGTNAVYSRVMDLLGEDYNDYARSLRCAINDKLWIPELGRYGQYLYGGFYPILSQSAENLGQSLAILWDVATPDMAADIMSHTPITPFGTTSIYPQLPDIKPYHNDAVWPFVQAFWNLAAAKTGNEKALTAGMAALWRAAAMFCTNKELFVASTGDYSGTAVNSDAQLWSCAGNAAMVLRVLCGLSMTPEGLAIKPVIPSTLPGTRHLRGLHYRDAVINLSITGTGTRITSYKLDGQYMNTSYLLPADLEGEHEVEIEMASNEFPPSHVNFQPQAWMPPTPIIRERYGTVTMLNFDHGVKYHVYFNGVYTSDLESKSFSLKAFRPFQTLAIVPEAKDGLQGFTMRPIEVTKPGAVRYVAVDTMLATWSRPDTLRFRAPVEGAYFIDVRYCNGAGPVNTDSKCAIRTLFVNQKAAGPVIMPQRGLGQWATSGWSNPLLVRLKKGDNTLQLRYVTPQDVNMDGKVNTAIVKFVRIIKI